MCSIFIQWNENTSNYRRFDGGLEVVGSRHYDGIELMAANAWAAKWLMDKSGDYVYISECTLFNHNRQEVAIEVDSNEPASYDFGDGTIYVAEVES